MHIMSLIPKKTRPLPLQSFSFDFHGQVPEMMARLHSVLFLSAIVSLPPALDASAGDVDPIYKSCLKQCEKSGCLEDKCFQHCRFSSDGKSIDAPWYMQEPLYLCWKQWDYQSSCRYHCMLAREEEREKLGDKPVTYHGKCRKLTEKLDYSSAVALLGFTLILAILRAFNVRDEAARVMVAAPLIFFCTRHILYLNFYKLDHGLNTKVYMAICVTQLLLWTVWAAVNHHPSRWKLWVVVLGGGISMLPNIYDFLPYHGR